MMKSGHFQYNHVHALLFSLEKIHRNEKKNQTEIYNGRC